MITFKVGDIVIPKDPFSWGNGLDWHNKKLKIIKIVGKSIWCATTCHVNIHYPIGSEFDILSESIIKYNRIKDNIPKWF